MDILLQYLNIKKRKQEYVKVVGVPCYTVFQVLKSESVDDAVCFADYMQKSYQSTYLFVGLVDAAYCGRTPREVVSYTDFCRLTRGLGEAPSID